MKEGGTVHMNKIYLTLNFGFRFSENAFNPSHHRDG